MFLGAPILKHYISNLLCFNIGTSKTYYFSLFGTNGTLMVFRCPNTLALWSIGTGSKSE